MIAFIPEWHLDIKRLSHNNIMSIAKLLVAKKAKTELILVKHHNNLRYFMNQNGLLNIPYWDALDTILDINITGGKYVAVTDVVVPNNAEMIFYDNLVNVYVDHKIVDRIHVHPTSSRVKSLDRYYENGDILTEEYDGRGFMLKKTLMDNDGQVKQISWLNEYGQEVLTSDGQEITVNPLARARFDHDTYPNLDAIINEFTKRHMEELAQTEKVDFIATGSEGNLQYLEYLQEIFPISYLVAANDLDNYNLKPLFAKAKKLFVPNDYAIAQMMHNYGDELKDKLEIAYPYPTELALGKSAEYAKQKILWSVSGMSDQQMLSTFMTFAEIMRIHENSEITVINVSLVQANLIAQEMIKILRDEFELLNEIKTELLQAVLVETSDDLMEDLTKAIFKLRKPATKAEHDEWLKEIGEILEGVMRYRVQQNNDQKTVQREMSDARIFIDLNHPTFAHLQISAISAGIPIIAEMETPYVSEKKNGLIIRNLAELKQGINYYLDGLENWNLALVENVELIDKFSRTRLFDYWEGVFDAK